MLDSINELKKLLQMPAAEHNLAWARLLCEAGRDLHLNVWGYCLPKPTVERIVLRLYDRSVRAFENLCSSNISKSARSEIKDFRGNAIFRRYNLSNNYLNGKSPELATDEKLKALGARGD